MAQKTSPSSSETAKLSPGSSESSNSKPSKPMERKFSFKATSAPEKRIVRVSEMQQQLGQVQEELKKAKEEKSRILEELKEAKKMLAQRGENNGFSQKKTQMMETEVDKAKASERKMLESLVSQTKQLEETKIEVEEAKLEIRTLKESIKGLESSGNRSSRNLEKHLEKPNTSELIRAHEEIVRLRNELKLATGAEEKSKKAMDDLALALKEVTTETNQVKEKLVATQSELEIVRSEANRSKAMLKSTEERVQEASEEYERLKSEFEETLAAWNEKENGFINCMKVSEEEITKLEQDNNRLIDSQRLAREDNSKMRDIMKQAVNEATVVKEALEIARSENSQIKDILSDKDTALQSIKQEYECLKVSEAAALDSLKELKSLLAATSTSAPALDPGKTVNSFENRSFTKPKATVKEVRDDRRVMKFPSDRWAGENARIQNGLRDSTTGPGSFRGSVFDMEEGSPEKKNRRFASISNVSELKGASSLAMDDGETVSFDDFDSLDGIHVHDMENEQVSQAKQKTKKPMFRRFGDMLRRRSFHK